MRSLFQSVCLFFVTLTAIAQPGQNQMSTDVVVNDTVHYYFNKFYFKTGKGLADLPIFKLPFATSTLVAHVGSRFTNNETIVISGIDAFAARDSGSTKLTVPVRLYLCTLQNNKPVLPPIDCVAIDVTGDAKLKAIGGNFASGNSYTLTSDFAVLMRNVSIIAGDYIFLGHTGAKTATNSAALPEEKFGESNSYVRYNANFYGTTNSTITGLGVGTDYEFCIAPRVQYTLTSDHLVAANAGSVCTYEPMVFTSLSSKRFLQPQYNVVEFARRWNHDPAFKSHTLKIKMRTGPNPEDTLWKDVFPQDSSVGWYFAPEDNLANNPHPRFFLPANTTNNQVTFYTDSALYAADGSDSLACFYTNEFRTRYKSMSIYGRGEYHEYNDTFMICTSFCGKDGVGLNETYKKTTRIFPNPSRGVFRIEGLPPGARVKVFSVAGVLICDRNLESDSILDLSVFPAGVYILQAGNSGEQKFRIIKE
jgi:hypothetical protein